MFFLFLISYIASFFLIRYFNKFYSRNNEAPAPFELALIPFFNILVLFIVIGELAIKNHIMHNWFDNIVKIYLKIREWFENNKN